MNVGIRLHDTVPGTIAQRAAFARDQGFACIQLTLAELIDPPPAPESFSVGLARALQSEIDPLSIAVLECPLNLAHPDRAVYREMLTQYKVHLRLSAWMDGCVVGTETGSPNAGYDPANAHSDEALKLFIDRLAPVVAEAERLNTLVAIEPAYTSIVYSPRRARAVLDAFQSKCLKIILDPVNLLHPDNLGSRDDIIRSALALLGEKVAAVHLKDYAREGGGLRIVPCGQGEMDDRPVLAFVSHSMPEVPLLLEHTAPENAAAARIAVGFGFVGAGLTKSVLTVDLYAPIMKQNNTLSDRFGLSSEGDAP